MNKQKAAFNLNKPFYASEQIKKVEAPDTVAPAYIVRDLQVSHFALHHVTIFSLNHHSV